MRKAGLFFRLGFGLILVAFSYTSVSAQTDNKTVPQNAGVPAIIIQSNPQPVASHKKIENSADDPATSPAIVETSSKDSDSPKPVSSGKRNCTPRANSHPYSITRADFNNLPKDRQQFILDNLNKYSIID